MTDDPNARRIARGRLIDWTDGDLDAMAEIHIAEDDPLMLAFVRQYGTALLTAVITTQRETTDGDATNGDG